jgi:hypothetical protein
LSTLTSLIESALFLRPDQRAALLANAPSFTPEQQAELTSLLAEEPAVLKATLENGVRDAVTHGNEEFFVRLDEILHAAGKSVAKAEEQATAEDDLTRAEHLLDAA